MLPDEFVAGSELAAMPDRFERAVIDVLPRAVIVTTRDGRILLWNRRAEALYGWSEAEVLGRPVADVLVSASESHEADAIRARLMTGETWRGDFSLVRRDGDVVRVLAVNSPILDAQGAVVAVVGASEDVTDLRRFERQSADLSEHLALALEAGELGTWRWDMSTGKTMWDARLEALFGLEPGTFEGTFEAYVSLLHPDDVAPVLETVQGAVTEGIRYKVEHRAVWPDGSVHWLQGKGHVTFDEFGATTGTMGCVMDVTEQVHAARARERAVEVAREAAENERLSSQRLEFLGEVNDALAAASTQADVMHNVTRAAVPRLGDWCAMYVLPSESSTVPEVEIAHVDPTKVAYVRDLQKRFPYDPDATSGIPHVIRSGESEFYPEINDDVLAAVDVTDEAREVVRSLALHSSIAVPLVKRGRIIGAMQFVNSESSRAYTNDDLRLAQAIASRIASTLENRRLAEQQHTIATTLQASLLPDVLPAIPGVDIAVRYWAAGEANTVGGDFYDVFDVRDSWALVIGDVCGTGPRAASMTGLTRHTIRASAWSGAKSGEIISQVNYAVRQSGQKTFVTVLYCTLTPSTNGFELTVAAGGHPLPIVYRADGRCETIGEPGTLLGLLDRSHSTTASTELLPGDIVVLYTDGITDVRPPHDLTAGDMELLVERAARSAQTAEACATNLGVQIDHTLPFTARNDDIALLVVKVAAE